MFKQLTLLLRGSANQAADALAARNALTILDQQLRDAASAIEAAKRALAMAMAQDATELRRQAAAAARITHLEDQARAALAGGREDSALTAAQAMAALQLDQADAAQARMLLAQEITRLRAQLGDAERRHAALTRGRHLARLSEAVRRTRLHGFNPGALDGAEATLAALRNRQIDEDAAAAALDAMTTSPSPIADPGARARDILARLRPLAVPQISNKGA